MGGVENCTLADPPWLGRSGHPVLKRDTYERSAR
jgi:hypothetical protein